MSQVFDFTLRRADFWDGCHWCSQSPDETHKPRRARSYTKILVLKVFLRDRSSLGPGNRSTVQVEAPRLSVLQVCVDPFLDAVAALVFRVEADAEGSAGGLSPGDRAADPDSWQSQQSKRDFY